MAEELPPLFKHRTLDRALSELADSGMFFAPPDTLNDTLESVFEMTDVNDFSKVISEAWAEINGTSGSGAESSNKPAEPDENLTRINARENARLQTFLSGCGVYSMVARPNNQALWAYYSGGPSGVCYELQFTPSLLMDHQLIIAPVEYSSDRKPFNRGVALANEMRRAHQSDRSSPADIFEKLASEDARRRWGISAAASALSRKHDDWKHEEEVRVIAPRSGSRPILFDCLKRVHLWWQDQDRLPENLLQVLVRHPNVELMLWKHEHGRMVGWDAKWQAELPSAT